MAMRGRHTTTVTLTAAVYDDGTPLEDKPVYFYYSTDGVTYTLIDVVNSNSEGRASTTYDATGKTWFRITYLDYQDDFVWKWKGDVFRELKQKFQSSTGQTDFNVTRWVLVLGASNATTGWYRQSYVDITIPMILVSTTTQGLNLPPGTYVRTDALGITDEYVEEGEKIEGAYATYEVKAVRPYEVGEVFYYNEVDLTQLYFEES